LNSYKILNFILKNNLNINTKFTSFKIYKIEQKKD